MATLAAAGVGFSVGPAVLVEGVTLTAHPGEMLGVVGPNGAGKSTLLELLAGDRRPSSGSVTLDGQNVDEYRPHQLARMRAVLPQQTVVRFPFTAHAVVSMGRHPFSGDPDNSSARDLEVVGSAMEATDTLDLQTRIFPSLSSGEQARVALARILAQQTPVMLLDEPTATLDVRHRERTMHLLKERAAKGTTVVAVLHDLNLAAAYADRIALLASGRLAALGRPRQVLDAELLSDTYRQPMRVTDHPHRDCPLVLVE